MLSTRTGDVKGVEKLADGKASRVARLDLGNALVNVELVVVVSAHGLGMDEQFEGDVAVATGHRSAVAQ